MEKLAIIGTGIAGLGAAHFLHSRFDLTILEKNDYVGGHTNTVTVDENGREVPIDTGFMVYNEVTYPNLTRLFRELDVTVKPTSMSFSVQHPPTGLEYCGSSLNHLFGQRRNLFNLRFLRMLSNVNRFNAEALRALDDPEYEKLTLKKYVERRGHGKDFLDLYLVPMSSAVWSTPPDRMLEFPAVTLLRFFHNHGFLGMHTQHPWLTVAGGARSYVVKLTAPFRDRIRLGSNIASVVRQNGKVHVRMADGAVETFDKVVFACHGDQALNLLGDPTPDERALLGEFKYQVNSATLHTDETVMPRTKRCWASWNYRVDFDSTGAVNPSTVYWMNSLQGVSDKRNYFVSINGENRVNPKSVLKRIVYEHPLFSLGAVNAQKRLPELNRRPDKTTYFCGSYFKYGFHEDAFTSALELCRVLLDEPIWQRS